MASINLNQLSPLALSILGLENAGILPENTLAPPLQEVERPAPTNDRRVVSYHNSFQTRTTVSKDSPPSYNTALRQARFPLSPRHLDGGREILPKYTCTVSMEGPMHMLLESCSPFVALPELAWREVYVVLQGTQLNIHKVKSGHIGKVAVKVAGKLLRSYTLQHAEVGVAPDAIHHVLVPVTRLAHLIPAIARRRAFEKDPDMFRVIKRHTLRLRVETDQLILADTCEEQIFGWVNKICAGIDIAPAIDERNAPRQITVPRRRRRQRPQVTADLNDQNLIAEQERILQSMYPAFAQNSQEATIPAPETEDGAAEADSPVLTQTSSDDQTSNDQDGEDLDLSVLAEDGLSSQESTPRPSSRPFATRHHTASSRISTLSTIGPFIDNPINFDLAGKWAPPHVRTSAQQIRYIRRCMPLLFAESPRASNVMISDGKRVRAHYRTNALDEWSLSPPTYEAHDFPEDTASMLSRSASSSSSRPAVSLHDSSTDIRVASMPTPNMQISAETPMALLEKTQSTFSKLSNRNRTQQQRKQHQPTGIDDGLIMLGF